MKILIKNFICKIRGHKIVFAGSCPFTGLSYKACTKCDRLMPIFGEKE